MYRIDASMRSNGMAGEIPKKPSQTAFQVSLPAPDIKPEPTPQITNNKPVRGRVYSDIKDTNGDPINTANIKIKKVIKNAIA